jgi:DNA-directed RNA polymerase specialized sigma24 family protein
MELFDQRVAHAFAAIRAGNPSGMGQLYDLLGPQIYGLCRLITADPIAAQHSTIQTFTRIWASAGGASHDTAGTRWVFDLACDSARSTVAHLRHV